jgi:hypothetical protein
MTTTARIPTRRLLLTLVLALCAAVPLAKAAAAPPEVADVITADRPYGSGSYGFLFVTAYKAAVWTDARPWSMDVPFALSLTYGMHFSTDEMVSRANKEMKHLDPDLTDQILATYDATLAKALPAVKPGDRITALNLPGKPAQVYWNGTPTATIDDPRLIDDFFGIWLSPHSSAPSLRAALTHTR